MSKTHCCATCALWSLPPGREVGVCELGDALPLPGFDGNGVTKDDNAFWTTPESYCDLQAPMPPPGPPCPKCGEPTYSGFGLAGGGYGPYAYCTAEGCDYFEKWQEMDDPS